MIKYCGIFDMPCDDVGYNIDLEDDYCINDCNSCPECYRIEENNKNEK